jgi:glyoxylase-like metal-dependent hydrolase (beta-lactamase superfamily II)
MNATDDWYDVSRLTPRSYAIDEGDGYGSFLVEGEERSVVVDAGTGVGDLAGLVDGLVDTPVTLVLTHTHWDHIGAAAGFDDVRVSPAERPPDGVVAVDSLSDEFTHRPVEFARNWVEAGNDLPDGLDPADHAIEPFETEPLDDTGVDLGDRTLSVHPLPGHSPGHLGLLDPATDVLYGGDVVHFDRNLYVMFEDCDLEAYVDSMARVRDLREEGAFETLATSHNDPLAGADLDLVDDLLAGLREIAAGERDYEVVETTWGEAHEYHVGDSAVLTKPTV